MHNWGTMGHTLKIFFIFFLKTINKYLLNILIKF